MLLKRAGLILAHFSFWLAVCFCLSQLRVMNFPTNKILVHFDAGWYLNIIENYYNECSVAFFPLFPFLWKWLNFSAIQISLLNLILFSSGMLLLAQAFDFKNHHLLFYLSIPSIFFNYVPYSEALFFLFCSLLLVGFQRNLPWLVAAGIFLAGLTRSVSVIFIPPVIFTLLVAAPSYTGQRWSFSGRLFLYCLAAVASIFAVAYWQWLNTGVWFHFLEGQKCWGKDFQYPVMLPLNTWGMGKIMWLDGAAFFTGLISLWFCIYAFGLFVKSKHHEVFNRALLFSLAYIAIVTLITLFFTTKGERTSIHSLNRYVFATPFFTVAVHHFLSVKMSRSAIWIFLSILIACLFLMGLPGSLETHDIPWSASVLGVAVQGLVYLGLSRVNFQKKKYAMWIVYFLNMVVQLKLFDFFLGNRWVG